MTVRTLNYGKYAIFPIMGSAGFYIINRIEPDSRPSKAEKLKRKKE